MGRRSQFSSPGYSIVSVAIDTDTMDIITRFTEIHGDRSKAMRALILAGSASDSHQKVLEQEAVIDALRQQCDETAKHLKEAQDALAEAAMSQEAMATILPPSKKVPINWTKYPLEQREELQRQWLLKHPEDN